MIKTTLRTVLAIALSTGLATAHVSAAPKTVVASWRADFNLTNTRAVFSSCSNTGNSITFSGNVAYLGKVKGTIRVTNNKIDTKSYSLLGDLDLTLALADGETTFQKQGSAEYGVGGNPWIGWAFNGESTSQITWLGRCVQGASGNFDRNGSLLNTLSWTLGTVECSPQRTAFTTGTVNQLAGVGGHIYMYNSTNNPQQTKVVAGNLNLGGTLTLDQRPPSNGNSNGSLAGGNPHIYIKLEQERSGARGTFEPIAVPGSNREGWYYLGRCRDLAQ